MFAGHIGVALAAARVEPRIGLGVLAAASLLLDLVLWVFVLLGWESVVIPADFANTHQPEFMFPFSHGLVAGLVWAVLAGVLVAAPGVRRNGARLRAVALVAGVVFSHWLLDVLVHRPELPLVGAGSQRVGIGLWSQLPAALAVEAALLLGGMALLFPIKGVSRSRQLMLGTLCVLTLAFTIAGMTVAPPPPSAVAMAASSLAAIVVVCALMGWLGRAPPRH